MGLKSHDDFRKYKIFRRTYWTTLFAKIIRPYWTRDGKIEGYIIELQSGSEMTLTTKHIKEAEC